MLICPPNKTITYNSVLKQHYSSNTCPIILKSCRYIKVLLVQEYLPDWSLIPSTVNIKWNYSLQRGVNLLRAPVQIWEHFEVEKVHEWRDCSQHENWLTWTWHSRILLGSCQMKHWGEMLHQITKVGSMEGGNKGRWEQSWGHWIWVQNICKNILNCSNMSVYIQTLKISFSEWQAPSSETNLCKNYGYF